MPTQSDLVTDLPADFETFGQAVATSMADLLGGTTGQILAKASNTDMDFTWVTNDVGDITAVTAGTGLSGGGTSGAVTLSIDTAVTADLTTAQTLTNKTLTSPALTTPTISTLTTNGDLLYGTGSGAIARRAIGTTGQVLTVTGGLPTWETPAAGGGGKVLQVVQGTTTTRVDIATTTFTDSGLTATITPTSATSKILVLTNQQAVTFRATSEAFARVRLLRGATAIFNDASTTMSFGGYGQSLGQIEVAQYFNMNYLDSPATTSATTYKTQGRVETTANSGDLSFNKGSNTGTILLLEIGA
jgi:molybdopterin-binding protein